MRRGLALTTSYLATHLGTFSLMPVLPLMLQEDASATGWAGVGGALMLFTVSSRAASILVSGQLERLPARGCMTAGLLLAAVAFGALAMEPPYPLVLALLVVAGCGISVNGLVSRVYIAHTMPNGVARLRMFTAINVAVNVSASLGPAVGTLIHAAGLDRRLWLLVALCYLAAAAAIVLLLPPAPAARSTSRPLRARLRVVAAMMRSPYGQRLAAVNLVGWFLYAQLFSALPLFLAEVVDDRLIAAYFTVNAVLVIVAQPPATAAVGRVLRGGTAALTLLRHGFTIMAAAFVLLAALAWSPWPLFAGIVVFSLGEVVFVPLVDTAFADASADSAYEAYNARQVVTAAGESLGAFAGGAGYLALSQAFGPSAHLAVVGLFGMACAALMAVWGTALPDRQDRRDATPTEVIP